MNRPWIKQDFEILKELGFDVLFIESENLLRNLKKIISCHLLFEWFAYPDIVFLAKSFRRKVILNAIGHEVAYYPDFQYGLPLKLHLRPFIALGLKHADKVIAISNESARWAEWWGKKHVEIIYEGIDTEKFQPLNVDKPRNERIILTVANLEKDIIVRKNLVTLIRAMKLVAEKMDDVRLLIVGEKLDGYPQLRLLVEELNLKEHVTFTGKISDEELVYYYNICDVFVMPSLQEGFPTVCCEALSCGKPVITSNRPSMNEIFTPNNVLFINPSNYEEIAEAIIKVLKDPELAKRLGELGRKLVIENFSREARKKRLNYLIHKVLRETKEIGGIHMFFLVFYLASKISLFLINTVLRVLSSLKRTKNLL
jgi:glycosyltransferase involved in cell wall biosynthesis